MTESISAWEETALYEAKIRYEGERRKTELALAEVAAKTARKKARLEVLHDADFLTAFGVVTVICTIVGCITYGVTRPNGPPNPYEYNYKTKLVDACTQVDGHWDDYNKKCAK